MRQYATSPTSSATETGELINKIDCLLSGSIIFAISPDGNTIAVGKSGGVNNSTNSNLIIIDISNNDLINEIKIHQQYINCLAWSHDNNIVIVGSNTTIYCYNAHNGNTGQVIHCDSYIDKLSWNDNNRQIISLHRDGTANAWGADNGQLVYTIDITTNMNSFSQDGTRIASWDENSCTIWDTDTWEQLKIEEDFEIGTYFTWSADNMLIASVNEEQTLQIWNINNRSLLETIDVGSDSITALSWNPDSTEIALADVLGTITIWDITSRKSVRQSIGHSDLVLSATWSPNGTKVVSGGMDGTVCIWNAIDGGLLKILEHNSGLIKDVDWSKDGRYIASCIGYRFIDGVPDFNTSITNKSIFIWDAANNSLWKTLEVPTGEVSSVSWSIDSTQLAAGIANTMVRIFDFSHGTIRDLYNDSHQYIQTIAWCPDGIHIASAINDNSVAIWDITEGYLLVKLDGFLFAWSPDGANIAICNNSTINIWDIRTTTLLNTIKCSGWPNAISWSPDGKRIATDEAVLIRLWDSESGELLDTMESPIGPLVDLAWSPDSTRLVAGGASVSVWDTVGNTHGKFNSDILRFVHFDGISVSFEFPLGSIGEVLSISRQ